MKLLLIVWFGILIGQCSCVESEELSLYVGSWSTHTGPQSWTKEVEQDYRYWGETENAVSKEEVKWNGNHERYGLRYDRTNTAHSLSTFRNSYGHRSYELGTVYKHGLNQWISLEAGVTLVHTPVPIFEYKSVIAVPVVGVSVDLGRVAVEVYQFALATTVSIRIPM